MVDKEEETHRNILFRWVVFIMLVYRKINDIEFAVDPNKGSSLLCEEHIANIINGNIYAFIDYIYEKENKYTPLVATWELTNICNFKCKFCYINTSDIDSAYVSVSDAKKLIDDLVESGLLLVYLTGGEVLSHPSFIDIYIYLKKKGVYVVLLTNLSLLDDKLIDTFKEYPPLRITTSIYAMSEKQFKIVTGISQIIPKTILDNIVILKEMGIKVTAQTPVNTLTLPEYPRIAEWCFSQGIVLKSSNEIANTYSGEDRSEYMISDIEFQKIRDACKFIEEEQIVVEEELKCNFGYRYHFDCIAGKHTFAISYNLHLRPCFNIWESEGPHFNAQLSAKDALYKMNKYLENKKKEQVEFCSGCTAHEFCSECMMTQNKHIENLKQYMQDSCEACLNKLHDYIGKLSE